MNPPKKKVFSGIQPTSVPHLGNYLGALRQWVSLQEAHECLYCIVDLHALTTSRNGEILSRYVLDTAALALAVGIDPQRSVLFVQSDVSEHTELAWVLNCLCYMGELSRMTQFKEKSDDKQVMANVGLFDYPVLMTADILLYNAELVPVGDDQKQHLELARTLARRFNSVYGETFAVPSPIIPKEGSRIMGLDDPKVKMSKSAVSEYNYIGLTDTPELVRRKIRSAVTDSGKDIIYDEEKKPALANLLTIFSLVSSTSIKMLETRYQGQGYAVFKRDLAEALAQFLQPFQERLVFWRARPQEVKAILKEGARRAQTMAQATMALVKKQVGISV